MARPKNRDHYRRLAIFSCLIKAWFSHKVGATAMRQQSIPLILFLCLTLSGGCLLGPQPEPPGARDEDTVDVDGDDDADAGCDEDPEVPACESGYYDEDGLCDLNGGAADADPDGQDLNPGDMGRDDLIVPTHQRVLSPRSIEDLFDAGDGEGNDPAAGFDDVDGDSSDDESPVEDDDDDGDGYLFVLH